MFIPHASVNLDSAEPLEHGAHGTPRLLRLGIIPLTVRDALLLCQPQPNPSASSAPHPLTGIKLTKKRPHPALGRGVFRLIPQRDQIQGRRANAPRDLGGRGIEPLIDAHGLLHAGGPGARGRLDGHILP